MRYSIDLMISGEFADPAVTARLARTAEDAGWEGLEQLGGAGERRH